MILVTLGTQDKSFSRLLKEIDHQIELKNIKEEVIVQAGYTEYESKQMKVFNFLPKDEFIDLMDEASFLITHAGVGSIFDGLKKDKKIIVVPRLAKYQEHTNDHQLQVAKELTEAGYILSAMTTEDLEKVLKKIENFQPKKYHSNNQNMIELLENYIDHHNRRLLFRKKKSSRLSNY